MYLDRVRSRIAEIPGVSKVEVGVLGELNVYVEGHQRDVRMEALTVGQRCMTPVRVFYVMEDGNIFGESLETTLNESLEDFYSPVHVPGFAGAVSEAPPEEVASEIKGALKLKRLRGKTRGRPVTGWRYGDKELRKGTDVKFKSNASLQWTMGRTLNVKPGATAKVTELATKRPIVYLQIGSYDGVELPVHAIGHVFDVNTPKPDKDEDGPVNNKLGYYAPEVNRLVNSIGFGHVNYGDDNKKNKPSYSRGNKNMDDYDYESIKHPKADEEEEEMLLDPETKDVADEPVDFAKKRVLTGGNKPQ